MDEYYTCQRCKRVERYGVAMLDAKPICSDCLRVKRFGKEMTRCRRRKYHDVSHCEIHPGGGVSVYCACAEHGWTDVVVPNYPITGWSHASTVPFAKWRKADNAAIAVL